MDEGFTSFVCEKCHTEIEATLDLIGQETACPACGAKLLIPDHRTSDGVRRHSSGELDLQATDAMKRRTLRIDLGDF